MTSLEECVQDINLWTESLSVTTDIIVACAAIITAGVACWGLYSWRKEGKFKTAAKLKTDARALKRNISYFRAAQRFPSEYPVGYNLLRAENPAEDEAKALLYIYNNRWEEMGPFFRAFDFTSIEAEALLGEESRALTEDIVMLMQELRVNFPRYASRHAQNPVPGDDEVYEHAEAIITADPQGDDEFSDQINEKFNRLDEFLNKFM